MIYTFYSYKGGVGRSMALANVAEWFYEQGLRVVMIDWDLEAPGLESFFVSPEEIEKVRRKPGLLDMLLAYKDQYPLLPLTVSRPLTMAAAASGVVIEQLAETATDTASQSEAGSGPPGKVDTQSAIEVLETQLAPLEYFLYPIRPPASDGDKRGLWLLSAGWRTKERFAEYGRAVQNFSWSEFYSAYHGEAYFEWMRKQLNSSELADVVLIDSRTGLTEMGGVCTRQLADVVVSFTAPNVQNLTGVTAMTASFKKKEVIEARNDLEQGVTKRPLEVLIVPTRIDDSATHELLNFKREFDEQRHELPAPFRILKSSFWDLLIPYISKYAYGEKLALGDPEGNHRLQEAYKNLAAHLVLLAPEGGVIRARFATQLRQRFRLLPRVLLLDDGTDENRSLRQQLKSAGLSLWDNSSETSGTLDASQAIGNIDLAEFLVMPVNRAGVHSETFRKQWRYARQLGVCVQLVRSDSDGELNPSDLPLWLRDAHIYDPLTELDTLIEILKRPCIAARVPFLAPDVPENYVQRPAESERLLNSLLNSRRRSAASEVDETPEAGAVKRVALCGPPGCGKSALASWVCNEENVIAAFTDGILWVNLGELPDVPAQLSRLYTAVTGEAKISTQLSIDRLLSAKLEGKKCLLVVDDVSNETDLRPFLDILSTGALLFTTRNQNLAASARAERLVVGEMSLDESLELLVRQSGMSSDGEEAILTVIAMNLGGSPLALKLAGAELKQRLALEHNPDETARGVYEETETHGVVAFDVKNATDRDHSVSRSIAASLTGLSEPEKDAFLKLSFVNAETPTPISQLSLMWGTSESEAKTLALRFASLSLLDYDSANATVRLSRMMHAFLVSQRTDPSILNANIERAENIFSSLTPQEQLIAQRVLTRLVRLSRPEEKFPDSRRSYDLEKFDQASRPLLETLQKAGLLVVTGSAVQISDDSLVQSWNRLRVWLEGDREFLSWRQSLEANIAEWELSNRHNREVLLKGKQLAVASAWLSKRKDDLNEVEKLFITESSLFRAKQKRESRRAAAVVFLIFIVLLGSAFYLRYRTAKAAQKSQDELKALNDTRMDLNSKAPSELTEADYTKAIAAYTKLIVENPGLAEAYDGRAKAYSGLSDYDNAEKDFKNATEINPQYAEAWKDWGAFYKAKGDKSDAAAKIKGAEPSAITAFKQDIKLNYEVAIDKFSQAIRVKPDYVEAYFGRADTYTSKGDKFDNREFGEIREALLLGRIDKRDNSSYDLAIADYTKIIAELQQPTGEAYYKRALAYYSKGDSYNASADFQKASYLVTDGFIRRDIRDHLVKLSDSGAPTVAPAPAEPSIFIQYNDPDDEEVIKQVAKDLKARGFRVVGQPELSGSAANGDGDVRSFNPDDKKKAEEIKDAVRESLAAQGYDKIIKARPLAGYEKVPPGQIEVWIAPLRISVDVRAVPAK